MASGSADGKRRRAEARERRRAQTGNAGVQEPESEALHAARTAATAAAVGAAVGAVRALAERTNDESSERDEPQPVAVPDADEAPEPEARGADETPARDETDAYERRGASPEEAGSIARHAREHFRDLHGSEPESVTSLERTREGWVVTLEVVEVRRVPDSTDVLAAYRVELDDDGNLLGFKRAGRHYRAQADAHEGHE